MKNTVLLITIIAFILNACGSSEKKIDPELAQKIQADERVKEVKQKAEDLIRTGLTAGDGYVEVWIRDLNTFIETACTVSDSQKVREALLTFFMFQGKDGNIPDGYTTLNTSSVPYNFIKSDLAPQFIAHKNTVETDQESSLIQSVRKYISVTKDKSILDEKIDNISVKDRLVMAMNFLLSDRYNEKYGLLWGATTSDWGDVQPEHNWGVELDSLSHLAIDIYDNAMFVVAINDFLSLTDNKEEIKHWEKVREDIKTNVRKYLWDSERQKFRPHIYLEQGSPFPADFDEDAIHYHGGTAIAIEADMLTKDEILIVYNQMQKNVKAANAQTIGLTVYPPYPNGFFKNQGMGEYNYQNGGDWTWFGGRMVQQLIRNGYYNEAYEAIQPMLDRVIQHNGFFEFWTPSGEPKGSSKFRGSAGVLWKAIMMFDEEIKDK
ncbi:MAG: hypothetical protein LBV43_04600 [Prevotella sp.]|jgi:GH15 family glucan-1,4-alpha-glucosidase|nr:hypothetical protein [Prevotella sp.]